MDDFLTFLRINPYPHYLGIAFNSDMRNAIIAEAGFEYREVPPNRQYGAVTEYFRDGTHAAAMCIVTFFQEGQPAPWIMAHEAVHVADDVFSRCGVENTDEPYAYLCEWIVRMMVFAHDAHVNTPERDRGFCVTDQIKHRLRLAHNERSIENEEPIAFGEGFVPHKEVIPQGKAAEVLGSCPRDVYQLVMPVGLHVEAQTLVAGVAQDMANKLMKAQEKYGWTNSWRDEQFTPSMWTNETIRHIQKGDPLDVINYMAFARDRKWSADLLVDGFSAMYVRQEHDELTLESLRKADILLDAAKHEDNIDPVAHANRQYEKDSVKGAYKVNQQEFERLYIGDFNPNNVEPCCPKCQHPRIDYTSKSTSLRFYCKGCGHEFDKYDVRER